MPRLQRFKKLMPEHIDEIRSASIQRKNMLAFIKQNLSYEAMAAKHKVTITTINRIVNGKTHPGYQ